MRPSTTACFSRRATLCVVIILAAALLFTMLPLGPGPKTAGAAPPVYEPATFDLFSMFPQQFLSPSTGRTCTWMPLETRNIAAVTEWTWLSARSESPYFNALVMPPLVRPSGTGAVAKSWVLVSCSPATPDGTIGHIKITGLRGTEQHHVWLKVTALASRGRPSIRTGLPLSSPAGLHR